VDGGQLFEEPKQGFLARIFRRTRVVRTVRKQEELNLQVPAAHADAVRDAVERWLRGHGVAAAVTSAGSPKGNTRIRAKLDEAEAAKLDFSTDEVQAELRNLLDDALSQPSVG
jgi:hypothetical protein